MKFGLAYDFLSGNPKEPVERDDMVRHALLADKLGFDSIWAGEGHQATLSSGHLPSPLLALSVLSLVTKKIRLGTGVLLLPRYDILKLAEDTAVLDCLSGGRLLLGLAPGAEPGRRDLGSFFEEGVELLKALWSQHRVSHVSKRFSYKDVSVIPKPLQKPRPPLLIGGKKMVSAARAAKMGDGWIGATNYGWRRLKELIAHYRGTLGREKEGFVVVNRAFYIDDIDSSALKAAQPHFEELVKNYFEIGSLKGLVREGVPWSEVALEPLREELGIIGSPDTCIGLIEKYEKEVGVDQLNLRLKLPGMSSKRVEKAIRLLSSKVFPYFASSK